MLCRSKKQFKGMRSSECPNNVILNFPAEGSALMFLPVGRALIVPWVAWFLAHDEGSWLHFLLTTSSRNYHVHNYACSNYGDGCT